MTADGTIDRLVLGQDDAGPVGLHVRDVRCCRPSLRRRPRGTRFDRAGRRRAGHGAGRARAWRGRRELDAARLRCATRRRTGASYQDQIEYAPISTAIDALIGVCGGMRDDRRPTSSSTCAFPGTTAALDDRAGAADAKPTRGRRSVALADLSYLTSYGDQARFARRCSLRGWLAARRLFVVEYQREYRRHGAGRSDRRGARAGAFTRYDALAHRTFTLTRFWTTTRSTMRFAPTSTRRWRPKASPITRCSHPGLPQPVTAARPRIALERRSDRFLEQLDPGYHIAAMSIGLPGTERSRPRSTSASRPTFSIGRGVRAAF